MDVVEVLKHSFEWTIPALAVAVLSFVLSFIVYLRHQPMRRRVIASIAFPFVSVFVYAFVSHFLAHLLYGLIDTVGDKRWILALLMIGFHLVLTPVFVLAMKYVLNTPLLNVYLIYTFMIFSYLITPLIVDGPLFGSILLCALITGLFFLFKKDLHFIRLNHIPRKSLMGLHLSIAVTWWALLFLSQGYIVLGWDGMDGISIGNVWLSVVSIATYATEIILIKSNMLFIRTSREKELAALTDSFTGLLNLEGMVGRVKEELTVGWARNADTCFIYFNIIHYRLYNEQYGHEEGDKLLFAIRDALRDAFGQDAIIARHVSDRFCVFTKNNKIEEKIAAVDSVIKAMQKEVLLPLKAGIFPTPVGSLPPETGPISVAIDNAAGTARELHGDLRKSIGYYDETLKKDNEFKNYILSSFDEAMKKGYIRVYYQPIVKVPENRLLFLEALVRWDDPEKGLLFPGSFLPILEANHLTADLDFYVFERVCMDIRLTLDSGRKNCPVGVNLSAMDFEKSNFSHSLLSILDKYSLPKTAVYLELDQQILLEGDASGEERAKALSDEGFQVTLAGLGDPDSSVAMLKDRKFNWIKVSGRYMRDFKNQKAKTILKHLIGVGNALGSKMIVEGVETKDQLNFALHNGVSGAQGYLYCHPAPLAEVDRVLKELKIPMDEPFIE